MSDDTIKVSIHAAVLCCMALLSVGCGSQVRKQSQEVEAVYWHEGKKYSVAVKDGDGLKLVSLPSSRRDSILKVDVVCDVKRGDKPWYEYEYEYSEWDGMQSGGWLRIHIPSVDDLQTGDWDHGKHGTGATTRIDK